jgi:hypothetical protein
MSRKMQEPQDLAIHKRYLIRKLLDEIQGTAAIVSQQLTSLLQDQNVASSTEDKNLQQVRYLLRHPDTKEMTTELLAERLTQLQAPVFPSDMVELIISYLEISELLTPMLINKAWYRVTLQRWRVLLLNDFGVEANITKMLPHPNIVYAQLVKIIPHSQGEFISFIALYGLDCFCVCLDVEDKHHFNEFFQTNPLPSLEHIIPLGNLSLIRYLIEDRNRSALAFESKVEKITISSLIYLIEYWGGVPPKKSLDIQLSSSDLKYVYLHWNKLTQFLTVSNLALTGSVEAVARISQTRLRGYLNFKILISNAVHSRSVSLIRYLFEDPSFPLRKQFDEALKNKTDLGNGLDEQFILEKAASLGALSIVKYMIKVRRLIIDRKIIEVAIKSGSLAVVKYLSEHLKETDSKADLSTSIDFSHQKMAILSGSLRMLRYIRALNKQLSFDSDDLRNAANVGLLPIFLFILNSMPLLALDQTVLQSAMLSILPTALRELAKLTKITVDSKTLVQLVYQNNLFVLRQIVEGKKVLPTEETRRLISGIRDTRCKLEKIENSYDSARYLESVTPKNNSSIFWNRVLSFPCKNTVEKLMTEILFDTKGQPQKWYLTASWLTRKLSVSFYANTGLNRKLLSVTSTPEENAEVISTEINSVMYKILFITQHLSELTSNTTTLNVEETYLEALKTIKTELELGLSFTFEAPKIRVFYQHWYEIICKVILDCHEITETMSKSPASP